MLNINQFAAAVGCPMARAEIWHAPMERAMARFGINTLPRVADFLAQIGHESLGLSRADENMNYSAPRLLEVFGKYFENEAMAKAYAKKPEKIGNLVYANRMGNGDEASGDGYRYRARGPIGITGKDNYAWMTVLLGLPLVREPELLSEVEHGSMSAAAFWHGKKLNQFSDANQFEMLTRKVNGGLNGLKDRIARRAKARAALGLKP